VLAPEESLPAVGQGALAIECRDRRPELIATLAPLHDAATAACVRAERAVSRALGGSCTVPLAAHAEVAGGALQLRGLVASPDGRRIARGEVRGEASAPEQAEKRSPPRCACRARTKSWPNWHELPDEGPRAARGSTVRRLPGA
jgi:hydroxymethylbilane synthase